MHIGDENQPLDNNLKGTDSRGKEYEFSFVHMGGLRPFGREYFEDDAMSGYGGLDEIQFCPNTATPTLAQYMVFEVYKDRVVFHIRNTGTHKDYHWKDKLKEYTVYFK